MHLIPRDNHISVYRTKILWEVANLYIDTFVSFSDDPFPATTFYWRVLWLLWCHTSSIAALSSCMLFMNQIDLKMPINGQISIKLYGEFEYECIRRWLSNVLATDTWKVGHGKHSYFLINACIVDGGGPEGGLLRKLKGGPNLVHNKYNTTFHGSGWP